jgi:Spy/CpxP family protein refolding chaperone
VSYREGAYLQRAGEAEQEQRREMIRIINAESKDQYKILAERYTKYV